MQCHAIQCQLPRNSTIEEESRTLASFPAISPETLTGEFSSACSNLTIPETCACPSFALSLRSSDAMACLAWLLLPPWSHLGERRLRKPWLMNSILLWTSMKCSSRFSCCCCSDGQKTKKEVGTDAPLKYDMSQGYSTADNARQRCLQQWPRRHAETVALPYLALPLNGHSR